VAGAFDQAVKDVVPYMNDVVEGFDLPDIPQIYPPIARDYVTYNQQSDPENVEAAGEVFQVNKHRPRL
jgi:hypothetical protein